MQDDHKVNERSDDSALDLNFVPQWARKPPGVNPYGDSDGEDRDQPRHSGRRQGRAPRRDRSTRDGRKDRRPGRNRSEQDRAGRDSRPDYKQKQEHRQEEREAALALPVDVSFIPERKGLGFLVKEIRGKSRAYPLMDLAGLFLSKPDFYLVKVEVKRGPSGEGAYLYQVKSDKAAFLSKQDAVDYLIEKQITEFFDVQEVEVEPPSGNFVCVGRCSLSGELLGPPNYHEYNERIEQLHRERFSHMDLDQYRKKIEVIRDPEVVEQWKQSATHKTVYRLKKDGENAEDLSSSQAETLMRSQLADKAIEKVKRAVIPATVARMLPPSPLLRLIRITWGRESKFPFSLSLALRPAFRHMNLHLFKAGKNITFVTAIEPIPLDPSRAIESVQMILNYLGENPGSSRKKMVEALTAEKSDESLCVEFLKQLSWLIEKGHVIEFFDGTLSVPAMKHRAVSRQE